MNFYGRLLLIAAKVIVRLITVEGAVAVIQSGHAAGRKASERRLWNGETPVDGYPHCGTRRGTMTNA